VFTEDRLPISKIAYVRRNFLDLDADARARLAAAFNHVHSMGYIDDFAQMHTDGWPDDTGKSVHFTPQFLPWHRWMVREMEKLMQKFDPLVTIPYWDSAKDSADDLTDSNDWDGPMIGDFFGGEQNSGGNFDHWDIDRRRLSGNPFLPHIYDYVAKVRNATNYRDLRTLETSRIHTGAHNYIGEDMQGPVSPKDPLFYLHHCNVDRIWALWQLNHPDVLPQYDPERVSTDNPAYEAIGIDDLLYVPPYLYHLGTPTVRSVLSHRALGYRYAHDQRLEDEHQDEFSGEPPMLWGDSDAFTIAPNRIEAEVQSGKWKIFSFQLINDTDFSVEVDIERFPENSQGLVDGFVWFPLHVTLQPQDSHEHFVVFAPQHGGLYNFYMKVRVDPVGPGGATEITVPVIGSST
jgi:hypothetical protein